MLYGLKTLYCKYLDLLKENKQLKQKISNLSRENDEINVEVKKSNKDQNNYLVKITENEEENKNLKVNKLSSPNEKIVLFKDLFVGRQDVYAKRWTSKKGFWEIEEKASVLLEKCDVVTLASVNENGYPSICAINKIKANGFSEIFFFTSKRSHINGKATHFQNNMKASVCYHLGGDSVTLIGNVDIIKDMDFKREFDHYCDRNFFKKGVEDPKCFLLRFRTIEATFWIEGKFRTCKYKAKLNKKNKD